MNNKKGFLLLEVIVSIVIITTGLVYIMRAFSTAKFAISRSLVIFESGLLLESKMFEFEEKGRIEKDFKAGKKFEDNPGYSWAISTEGIPDDAVLGKNPVLNLVTLEVSRLKDKEEKRSYISNYDVTTYLNDKKSI